MLRDIDLSEISDGKFYQVDDVVHCGTKGCKNCYACCAVTGDAVVLDPYDCAALCYACNVGFDALLERHIGLRPVDGLILPFVNKTVDQNGEEICVFLDDERHCMIYAARPGICRMFPLGRVYDAEARDFSYILQIHECEHRTEDVRIRDWLKIPQVERYEQFVKDWHFFMKDAEHVMHAHPEEDFVKKLCMAILNVFYRKPYGTDFYGEFSERLNQMYEIINM